MNEFYDSMKPGFRLVVTGSYLKGQNKRNPGGFDYDSYLRSKGITGIMIINDYKDVIVIDEGVSVIKNIIFQTRKYINEQIKLLHSSKGTASLLRGLLLADRKEIDRITSYNVCYTKLLRLQKNMVEKLQHLKKQEQC